MQLLVGCCILRPCNEILRVRLCLLPQSKDRVELQEVLTTVVVNVVLSLLFHIPSIKGRVDHRDLILHLNIFLFLTVL